ncbi:hypothetical protein Taro_054551 [Colocasia esculenta]|uniref:Remorin C-terminal domain-containing protein n=1 Tax=Colocasia esculenta TaxID=4460 RepID=A0A843XR04_COLES|nr:hypothetical protein [Colocasia esculenta]
MVGAQGPSSSNSNSGNDNNNNNSSGGGDDEYEVIREIHALITPSPPPPPASVGNRRRESWENGSHRSFSQSTVGSDALSEQLASMSREFNALVLAGSTMQNGEREAGGSHSNNNNNLGRIGEEEVEETNPLAIVLDGGRTLDPPISSPRRLTAPPGDHDLEEVSVQRVKKEEVGSKISAWQAAKIAKINNRFKREDVILNGWESEQVDKATALFKKVERKLDEKRARAMEKMQNEVAKAHRKAEEKRASAEAKRGTKVARILEMANLMRAVGRAPSKRSFF